MEQGREDPQEAAWAQRAPFRRTTRRGAREQRRRWLVVAIALAHVALIAAAVRRIRENRAPPPRPRETTIEIELLAPVAAPAAPSPRGRASPRATPAAPDAPPSTEAIGAERAPPPPPPLFDERGALRLPKADDDRFDRRAPASLSETLRKPRALVYEPTRFEKYFVPDHETLGQRLVRKVPLLGFVLPGVNAPHCGTDPDRVPEACDPQRIVPDLNTLTHPLDTD